MLLTAQAVSSFTFESLIFTAKVEVFWKLFFIFLSWQKFGECLPGDVLKLLFDSNSYVCATAARALVAFGAEGAKTLMDRRQ